MLKKMKKIMVAVGEGTMNFKKGNTFLNNVSTRMIVISIPLFLMFLVVLLLKNINLYYQVLVIFSITSVWILLASLLLKQIYIKPIEDLGRQISLMIENQSFIPIKEKGSKEIIHLIKGFNHFISRMQNQGHKEEYFSNLSNIDCLTSLYNHKYFYECLNENIDRRCKAAVLLFCDLDKFKILNDIYGHGIGNKVLEEVANILKRSVQGNGRVFRYGADEFAVLLENTTVKQAYNVGEHIRLNTLHFNWLKRYKISYPITISVGIAAYPYHALSVQDVVVQADEAMRFVKQNGGNQCCVYEEGCQNFKNRRSQSNTPINAAIALAAAIDAKDLYTGKHSELVAKYALLLAEKLSLSVRDKRILRIGSLLHDCGKIGIPDAILRKPDKLTEEEFDIIRNHTILGNNIVKHITENSSIISCVRSHHERWDGKGYPDQLAGESISLYARIVCIADAYHAMTSDRPYRKALTEEEALKELRKNKGLQFEPKLVDKFVEAIEGYMAYEMISR
ncbi:diguanylate cyclase [Clostridiaceae bacterium 35-E11]